MDTPKATVGAATLAAFSVATVLGAGNFLAVRFSNRGLPPFWGAGLRFGAAAIIFTIIVVVLRQAWPRGRLLAATAAYGALSFGVFYALMYWALVRVTAGVGTVVMAVVPIMTLLLAGAQGLELVRARNLFGAVLALGGIIWMVLGPGDTLLSLTALAAMLVAAVCVSEGIILAKRLSGNHPAVTNAVGMASGALVLLVVSSVAGEAWTAPQNAEAAWAVLYLVTFGSAGLFALVLFVVGRWTASATSYLFVLFPLVTLVLERVLDDQPITGTAVTGALLVMAGVWFGALSPGARQSAPGPTPLPAVASVVATEPTSLHEN